MKNVFICPKCKNLLDNFICPECKHEVPVINSVYRFCDDPPVKLEGENKYIGYDYIGEDFEPEIKYWDANNKKCHGVYNACGNLVAETFGKNITVLDLGAGLGSASLPIAGKGIFTVAGDISNIMLSTAVKRAGGRYKNLVFVRMNAYDIPLADNSVDIVVENALFHLMDNPERVIREIVRVLKPKGCLVRYGSSALELNKEEEEANSYCNSVINDISEVFYKTLDSMGCKLTYFDNHFFDIILNYFNTPCRKVAAGFAEEFTDKLKFRLHRIKNGAHSDLVSVPKETIDTAWQKAHNYAVEKYGGDYFEIKGFSRYGACIYVYEVKGK